jgi:diguanylate cyclase (GGDEF)-like protein
VPLAAVRRALESHVRWIAGRPPPERTAATDRVREAAGRAAPLLAGLSPELGGLLGSPAPEDDGGQLFGAAAVGFLVALARAAGGLVLCLDDVQWLDDGTRRVLLRLATELRDAPLLVLATARDDRAGKAAVTSFREALGPVLDLEVPLGPLGVAAVAELVADAGGGMRLDGDGAAALAAHSHGNPFVVLECLPAIIDAGLLRPVRGRWSIDPDGLRDLDLSAHADRLVLDRLDGLDPVSRELLGIGAVIGPRFTAELVAAVGGAPARHVREVAGAAAWRRLVEVGDGGYVFVHDRIREALLDCFDEPARRAVHGRIAEALDRRPAADAATTYALARHCQLAGAGHDPQRTFRACAAAGHRAVADHAPAEALSFFDTAADRAARAGIGLDVAFHQGRGTAQHRVGRCADAIESLNRAHDLVDDPVERARILCLIARVHDTTWSSAEQVDIVNRALVALGRPLPANAVLRWLSTLAMFAAGGLVRLTRIGLGGVRGAQRERYRLLVSLYEAAVLAHARQMAPGASVMLTLRQLWWVSRLGPGPESARTDIAIAHLALAGGLKGLARRATRRAVAAATAVGDPRLGAYVEWLRSVDRVFFGMDQGEAGRRVLAERGRWLDVGLTNDLLVLLITYAFMRGDLADAEQMLARRLALLAAGGQSGRMTAHTNDACVLALQGDALGAATYLQRIRDTSPALLRWERINIVIGELMLAVEQHDLDTRFEEAAAEFDTLGVKLLELMPSSRFVYVFLAFGRLEQCRRAAPEHRAGRLGQARAAVRQLGRAANAPVIRGYHQVARAALAQVSGDHARALKALARAEPILHEADAPLVAFEAARVRAHALRALHVEGEAHRQAGNALALATEHRWPHRARRIEAEFGLDRQPHRASSGHASSDAVALGRYRQRLDAIQQVGDAASRVLDPERLAAIALDETIRILGAERAHLFLVDDDGRLVPAGGRDARGRDLGEPTGHSATLVERVRRTGEPLVVTGTEEGVALGADSVVLHGLRSVLVAPLQHDGRLAGVVYLDSRVAKGIFTDDDVGILVAIANHIVLALETAKAAQLEAAIARAHQQRDLAETVRDALAGISGSLERDEVLRRMLATVLGVAGTDRGWLLLAGEDGGPARVLGVSDAVDPAEPIVPPGRLTRLLSITEPVIGSAPVGRSERWGDCAAAAWMVIPLTTRDRHVGVIALVSGRHDAFTAGEADMAVALIAQGMIAYDNARLFAQVQHLAATDGLTGVANRRHFFEQAERALERARAGGHPLAALMIDVDHFKAINDRHGHRVGDAVLEAVAHRLAGITRDGDLLGRYGGEEFAMVLAADEAVAGATAERLRRTVANGPVPTPAGPVPVTISIGIALVGDGAGPRAGTIYDLLDRADRGLYRAKRSGRNRVFTEETTPPP